MFPRITFATSCWERDWRRVLLDPDYLATRQIGNLQFSFAEKLLVINNVKNLDVVKKAAQEKVDQKILTSYVVAQTIPPVFQFDRSHFNDWQYYNALSPFTAIYECQSEYLLYLTGDVYLKEPVDWIPKALRYMQKNPQMKVANLTWNDNYEEAKKESAFRTWNFFVAEAGFSDQMFLVRKEDFCAPIYGEVRSDTDHYPKGGNLKGGIWEARVFSYMKNHHWRRITFRRGSYTHENVAWEYSPKTV